MNKETFEAYLTLENIVALMTNINFRLKEKEIKEKYEQELIDKSSNFKQAISKYKEKLCLLRNERQELYMQIINIDSLPNKSTDMINKRNTLYDEYKDMTRILYDQTMDYNKMVNGFNRLNGEITKSTIEMNKKNIELDERIELCRTIYNYCEEKNEHNDIIGIIKKMDENNISNPKNETKKEETQSKKSNLFNSYYGSYGSKGNELSFKDEQKAELKHRK